MARPTFEVNVEYIGTGRNRMPHRVTVRPVRTPNDDISYFQVKKSLVSIIRSRTTEVIRGINPRIRGSNLYGVRGFLQGVNLENASSSISRESIAIRDLTMEFFDKLMIDIHESNADIGLLDIEWSFVIDPNSLIIGGGRGSSGVKKPAWVTNNLYVLTWKEHTYGGNGRHINCAAFALSMHRYYLSHRVQSPTHAAYSKILRMAFDLQIDFGWGDSVSIDEISKYVEKYPEFRITVVLLTVNDQSYTTFYGDNWNDEAISNRNCVYLIYDAEQEHYALTKSPLANFRLYRRTNNFIFCEKCVLFIHQKTAHVCDVKPREVKRGRPAKCKSCGVYGEHTCPTVQCKVCSAVYKRKDDKFESPHRCILFKDSERSKKQEFYYEDEERLGKKYCLFAYDFESRMNRIHGTEAIEFVSDEDGDYILDDHDLNTIQTVTVEKSQHVVNLVVFKDVFSNDDPIVYYGDDAIRKFIMYMLQHNRGKNICIAHNASGYDARLVFEEASKIKSTINILPITRGCKFMQITIGDTIFRDSLLHLKGSLKNLALDFLGDDCNLRKGHFPHLFNTEDNIDYVGHIPAKRYFDISNMVKSEQDLIEFNAWYDSQRDKHWNFRQELEAYCINDVEVLANIAKRYHEILVDKFEMSPWFNATSPSYVHEVFIRKLSAELELPADKKSEEYIEYVENLARNEFWAVLVPSEYWFARCALRGGRTEIRKIYHNLSDQDILDGKRIRYQDIVSMYPYVQAVYDYPVGLPTIHVYDPLCYPCHHHRNRQAAYCHCDLSRKISQTDTRLNIVNCIGRSTLSIDTVLGNDDFFGIVCATVIPPTNLFHPILLRYCERVKKCVASLEPIYFGVFTSVEFRLAVKHGYIVDKIHRYDQYKKKKSLWAPVLKDMFIEKMANSQESPGTFEMARLEKSYQDRFGMGKSVRESFKDWKDNKARKQTAKIQLNSGWGKHAERPIMPEVKIINSADTDGVLDLYRNFTSNTFELQDTMALSESRTFFRYKSNGSDTNPNLHKSYLPAAIFVPAYGRVMLWEQLNKLGDRVLMHDTDSIVYVYDPKLYNIPRGDIWGDWDVEKIDYKNDGIKTFIGLCPKSYAIKTMNDKTMIKMKGISLKYATRNLLNFDILEELVLDHLNKLKTRSIGIPQMNFVYRIGQQMVTWHYLKNVEFKPNDLKGNLTEDGVLLPYDFK